MSANRRIVTRLLALVVFMGAAAWAAVPFYSWFCRTTGYGGTPQRAEAAGEVLDQMVEIRFDANVAKDMPWQFRPKQNRMTVRIGEPQLAFYEAFNPTDRPIAGTAAFNVAPDTAGAYFDKIECFCFTEQVLQPGERVEMPVSFFVDPDMARNPDTARIQTITLSYTFFETPLPEEETTATVN
ncbi:cytochrome c oxidase assembly protein [Paenirhodobacter sp.]|uniref:cytochrome c oxidase assembly protein n=1 Tax=Paenirhodobacter sp. TaxID=1965326 RepID=UPI003B3D394E